MASYDEVCHSKMLLRYHLRPLFSLKMSRGKLVWVRATTAGKRARCRKAKKDRGETALFASKVIVHHRKVFYIILQCRAAHFPVRIVQCTNSTEEKFGVKRGVSCFAVRLEPADEKSFTAVFYGYTKMRGPVVIV
jgi:hypothetical protein